MNSWEHYLGKHFSETSLRNDQIFEAMMNERFMHGYISNSIIYNKKNWKNYIAT